MAILSGGRRGSSAQGQGEVGTTLDTWSASVPVLMPYFSSFYVKANSDPEGVFLALWRVGVHAEWRSAHSRSFSFPCLHLEFGQYVMSPLYLAVPVRCLVSAQCLVRQRIHVLRLPCHGAEDVPLGPVQQTTDISQLQSVGTVVVVVVTVEIPQLQPVFLDPVVRTPVVCNDSCLVDVLAQFIDGSHVPVIMQRRLLSGSAPGSVFVVDGGRSSCATEKGDSIFSIAVYGGGEGLF